MEKLELCLIGMAALVICVGIGMMIDGYLKSDGLNIGLGVLLIFLGSYLIFVRLIFRDEKPKSEEVVN